MIMMFDGKLMKRYLSPVFYSAHPHTFYVHGAAGKNSEVNEFTREIMDWVSASLSGPWTVTFSRDGATFHFMDQKDLVLFKTFWG